MTGKQPIDGDIITVVQRQLGVYTTAEMLMKECSDFQGAEIIVMRFDKVGM